MEKAGHTSFRHARGPLGPTRQCIIDAFRLRQIYGTDQAVGALRNWLAQRGSQPSDLLRIAASFPAAERPTVRVIDTSGPWFRAMVQRMKVQKIIDFSICDLELPAQAK